MVKSEPADRAWWLELIAFEKPGILADIVEDMAMMREQSARHVRRRIQNG